jgi:thioredoxin reductase (NADPH)
LSLQVAFPPAKESAESFDAIVVGAGPAGLATSICLTRVNLKTLVLEADKPGGRLNSIGLIENYLGFPSIQGEELAKRMVDRANMVRVKIVHPVRVIGFEFHGKPKILRTREREYHAETVLLAMGVQHGKLRIPGAMDFFKGRDVALVGEDEETIEDGLYLARLVNKIYLISGFNPPKFSRKRLEKLLSMGNVEHLAKHEPAEITGESVVERIKIKSADGKMRELDIQRVFIAGEKTPVGAMLANTGLETDSSGCVKVDSEMRTNLPEVYAAGDITCGRKFQIAVSVGQGVTVALSMIRSPVEAGRKRKS